MGNGKWKMENENGNGKRGTGNGKRETGNGKRETGNGKRKTGNEERGTGNAYLKSKTSALPDRNFSTRKNLYNNNNNNNDNNNNNGLISVHPWYGSSPDVK